MKKIKMMIFIALFAINSSLFAKEYTVKEVIAEVTSVNTITTVTTSPFFIKYLNLIDLDLKISFVDNKLQVTSKDAFKYIKINNQRLPKNAKITLQVFDIKVMVAKKKNVITVNML